jgi:hypothetical protein
MELTYIDLAYFILRTLLIGLTYTILLIIDSELSKKNIKTLILKTLITKNI